MKMRTIKRQMIRNEIIRKNGNHKVNTFMGDIWRSHQMDKRRKNNGK